MTRESIARRVQVAREESFVDIHHYLHHRSKGWGKSFELKWMPKEYGGASDRVFVYFNPKQGLIVYLFGRFNRGEWQLLRDKVLASGIGYEPFIEALEKHANS